MTAFALGTWQVKRLGWKTRLLARLEDRITRPPLPLPPEVGVDLDPDTAAEALDYRRVLATGHFLHEKEMLLGPRVNDGESGFFVITPLVRDGSAMEGKGSTVLVNRGWIHKDFADQRTRLHALPHEEVTVEGLLRKPWKKNIFTPDNQPEKNGWYFPDVKQMADWAGAQPIWIEATTGMFFAFSFSENTPQASPQSKFS